MVSRSRSISRSQSRDRSRSQRSRTPGRPRSYTPRSASRSPSPPRRRNGRYRSYSRSPSRSRSFSRSRSRSFSRERYRGRSETPPPRTTKIVVERLSKNITEGHLHEIFGHYGPIADLDLPIGKYTNTNRGTAYILYDYLADAEAAIANMHEAEVDGAIINVSIVLPRRMISPAPPLASRGANIDPRVPFSGPPLRGGPGGGGGSGWGRDGPADMGNRRRRPPPASSGRLSVRSDVYRPASRSGTRSRSPPRDGGGSRYRSRTPPSVYSRSRSRSFVPR